MRLFNTAYLHLSKAVVVLAMFTLVAFYPRYLTVITSPLPWYMHAHFVLMIIWMSMLFLQPRFVGKKDFAKHRALGRVSYLLVPLILISSYLMIRFGYYRILAELQESGTMTADEAMFQARINIGLGPISFFALLIFYPLAIVFRKNPQVHATYMVGTALSIVGPILDRALYQIADWYRFPTYPFEYVSFFLVDMVLVVLLVSNYQKGLSLKANQVCLFIFVSCQVVYAFFLDSWWWQGFVGWVL